MTAHARLKPQFKNGRCYHDNEFSVENNNVPCTVCRPLHHYFENNPDLAMDTRVPHSSLMHANLDHVEPRTSASEPQIEILATAVSEISPFCDYVDSQAARSNKSICLFCADISEHGSHKTIEHKQVTTSQNTGPTHKYAPKFPWDQYQMNAYFAVSYTIAVTIIAQRHAMVFIPGLTFSLS